LAKVDLKLLGLRQVTHALAAAALARTLEIDVGSVVAGLEGVVSVAGHLEAVDEGQDFEVRIDAAATASPLRQALDAVRAISPGRVHLVLSAEGGQERSDRRELAQTAEAGAERVILTLSNPRTEQPDRLLDELLGGFRRPDQVLVQPDRKLAIEIAVCDAGHGDAVLIAGKGRNTYQIFADRVVPFDDFATARAAIRRRQAPSSGLNERSA
jgi:UDP-N-acetylmuramoyl-L-alanyl-D-glutamate--2,6-diaminopimelate ligase